MQVKALSNTAVFGGSFNPFHEGHLGIIQALSADTEIARVVVVPNRISPFKTGQEPLPDAVRLEMLRRALAGVPKVSVCDLELRRPGPSFTYRTVQVFSSLLPRTRLFLAIGWDAFAEFAQWHQASEILALAGLIVFNRAGEGDPEPDPAGWRQYLPPPWNGLAAPADSGRLTAPDGRLLLRYLPARLPPCSAREILAARSLQGVPPGAREVLEDYWDGPGAAAGKP